MAARVLFLKNTDLMSHSPACHSQRSSVSLRIKSHPPRYSKPPPSYPSEWLLTKRQEITSAGEGQGSLACCSPWGRKESDMTERLNNEYWRGCGGKGTLVPRVGMQLGAATMENSREVPQNIRNTLHEVAQLCPTLCDPMDCSPPGSPIRGIF